MELLGGDVQSGQVLLPAWPPLRPDLDNGGSGQTLQTLKHSITASLVLVKTVEAGLSAP